MAATTVSTGVFRHQLPRHTNLRTQTTVATTITTGAMPTMGVMLTTVATVSLVVVPVDLGALYLTMHRRQQ